MTIKNNLTVREMVALLQKEEISVDIQGDLDAFVNHLRNIDQADRNSLVFYTERDASRLSHLEDCVLICVPQIKINSDSVTLIITEDPKLAFYILAQEALSKGEVSSIHPTAIIDSKAVIDPSANIGPYCVIHECHIGANAVIHPHVILYDKTKIGNNVVVEANTVIGATGQVWAWDKKGKKRMLPQIGGTIIEEDCFIGANITIVRGSLQDTVIHRGCRIAHGTMIGHNCHIGEDTYFSNGIAMGGSCTVGKLCFLGSNSTYRAGTVLGDNIIVGSGAAVVKDFKDGDVVITGIPAKVMKKNTINTKFGGIPRTPGNRTG